MRRLPCGFLPAPSNADLWHGGFGRVGIVGNFADHFGFVHAELDAADISYGYVEGAEDKFGAFEIDGIADEGVDDLHERGLDGLLVLNDSDGVKARFRRGADAPNHALVEVAELLSTKGGRAAADSGDFNVGTDFDAGLNWHIAPITHVAVGHIDNFLVVVG